MSPEDFLIGAAGFALGALTTFALWVPRGGGIQPAPPTTRPQGWAPRPPPGYVSADVRPPPPKVYPEGQPPRRRPPTMGCSCDAEEPQHCGAHPSGIAVRLPSVEAKHRIGYPEMGNTRSITPTATPWAAVSPSGGHAFRFRWPALDGDDATRVRLDPIPDAAPLAATLWLEIDRPKEETPRGESCQFDSLSDTPSDSGCDASSGGEAGGSCGGGDP